MPAPSPRTPPPRIQIHDVRPSVEGGRWPVKRTLGDPVVVECDLVRDGHEQLRAVVRHRPPGRSGVRRGADGAARPRPLARRASRRPRWAATRFQVEAWVDPFALVARRARAQAGRRPGGPRERARPRAPALLEDAAGRLRGARPRGRGRGRPARCARRRRPWPRAPPPPSRRAWPRRSTRGPERRERGPLASATRWTSTASGPASAPGTSSSRARSGGFAGVPGAAPAPRRAGLRRALPAADPPDRRARTARGATTPPPPSPASPAAPGRSAAPEGGHTAVDPGARHARRLRGAWSTAARGARPGDRARLRDPVLARPPLAAPSTRSGSTAAPTAP